MTYDLRVLLMVILLDRNVYVLRVRLCDCECLYPKCFVFCLVLFVFFFFCNNFPSFVLHVRFYI